MTGLDVGLVAKPEPKRDRFGRYVIPNAAGKPTSYTRATTVAEAMDDRYNLERWKQRQVAYGIGQRKDLYALAASHDPENDRGTYDQLVDKAMEAAKSSAAASEGTALHRFTENLDAGRIQLDDIPDEWRDRCRLYQETMAGLGIEWTAIEQILVDDRYEVAGTTDRIAATRDGRALILDLKTGKNLAWSWQAIAIQLAIYANHTATYDPLTDQRGPRIDVDTTTALVVHLPAIGPEAGTCSVYEVDITAGYGAYLTALEVRTWRKTKTDRLARVHRPGPPELSLRDWLAARIQALAGHAQAVGDLRARWPATVPQPLPADPTPEQVAALELVLDVLEAKHQIPLGPSRPGANPQKAAST
jgi:PD-(D/E)XK nuclease superfamily